MAAEDAAKKEEADLEQSRLNSRLRRVT